MTGAQRGPEVRPSGSLRVRRLIPTDRERVLTLNNAEVPRVSELTGAGYEHYQPLLWHALGATEADSGGLLGWVWTVAPGSEYRSANYRWVSEHFERFVYLDRVVVAPEGRRRGVARSLYEHVIADVAPDAEWFVLEVNVDPPNPESLAFHRSLGFEEVGRSRPYPDHPELGDLTVAYLAKRL